MHDPEQGEMTFTLAIYSERKDLSGIHLGNSDRRPTRFRYDGATKEFYKGKKQISEGSDYQFTWPDCFALQTTWSREQSNEAMITGRWWMMLRVYHSFEKSAKLPQTSK